MTKFNLTAQDKQTLLSWGYTEEDFLQIEEAANRGKIEHIIKYFTGENVRKISPKSAINYLGRTEFLSGLSRAAFHWTAIRDIAQGEYIYFNASNIFTGE